MTYTVREHTVAEPGHTTMSAVVQDGYGGAEVFRLDRVDRPVIGPRDVLVDVRAAGLDRGTWHIMTGRPLAARAALGIRRPRATVPGLDVAGVVVAVGDRVTRFSPGDEVHGIGRGSFAEQVAAPEDKLSHIPAGLGFESAAVVSVSGATAIRAVVDAGRVEAGHRVLITGASGGVGTYAVQIAVARGARVTGVCSAPKADLVRSIGAERVVDYRTEDPMVGAEPYDTIIDIAGNTTLRRLRAALTPTGAAVIVGGEGDGRWLGGVDRQLRALLWSPFVSQRLTAVVAKEHHREVDRVDELIAAGSVTPVIDSVVPLGQVREAMQRLIDGDVRGKIVLVP